MADGSHSALPTGAIGLLADEKQPVGLDSVEVQSDGSVVRWPRDSVDFTFDFHGATFTAQGRRDNGGLQVALSASLGPLPFSAESLDRRHAIQGLVVAKSTAPGPSITIDEAMDIRISGKFDVPQPVSPVAVLTGLTEILLELKPWLAQLAGLLDNQPRAAVS